MTTHIMYSNASFPQWTFSELALAEIGFETELPEDIASLGTSTAPSQLSINLPAIRAVMNCTTHPYTSAATIFDEHMLTFLEVNMTFSGGCPKTLHPYSNATSWSCNNDRLSTQWYYKPGIIGYWSPDYFGDPLFPTTIGLFGKVDAKGNTENLTMLTCAPYVETVQANATFNLPSFDLVPSAAGPPVTAIESTVKFFNNDSFWSIFGNGDTTQNVFDVVLPSVYITTQPPLSSSDGFFQALFQGIDAIDDPNSLLGPVNSDKLIAAVEHLYRIIMAQCFHSAQGIRLPITASSTPPQPDTGVIIDPNRRRLYQSPIATYILIALLATMFVCALVTVLMFKPKGLLSKEPNSIAARAGLLAGSDLVKMLPEEAEWCSDEELRRAGVLNGLVFRLDWWGETMRYGIDIEADTKI